MKFLMFLGTVFIATVFCVSTAQAARVCIEHEGKVF